MFCWGRMKHGELGLGGLEEEIITSPRVSPFTLVDDIVQVGCGENHTILVMKDGKLFSFGLNDYGQLGHGRSRTRAEPVDGLEAHNITQVACGAQHTLAQNEWGEVFAWGSNSNGQLGLNVEESMMPTPKMVKSLATKQVVQIACGRSHSMALTNVGEIYCWGSNSHGQLGLGSSGTPETKPCLVKLLQGIPISHISCGADFSFAVTPSGAVYGWGKNSFGQLGLGDTVDRPQPTQLKSLRFQRVTYIRCGMDHTAALTRDGGVFTFGAGMYGQLGHCTSANEMLPRKVLELMGTTVTQICCGRCHTLAFVPSKGRIYAFGLGGSGQLGTKSTANVNSPQLVIGPWETSHNNSIKDVKDLATETAEALSAIQSKRVVVRNIFCGGDQSFSLVSPYTESFESADYREHAVATQILSIFPDEIKKVRALHPDVAVDLDLLRYVETVFSHLACYNASFLRADGSHYGCSSKNHGLDLHLAAETFGQISRIEHPTICVLLRRCICNELLSSLSPVIPDIEVLRVYLILPLYHEFLQPKFFEELHFPFACVLLGLKPEAGKVYDMWLAAANTDYFIRLINIFKQVVVHIIHLPSSFDPTETTRLGIRLKMCLDVLKKINNVNRQAATKKVGHEQFYIPELTDKVDVKRDYFKWLVDAPNKEFRLCNYSFVFDAKAKTLLLEADQNIQMHSAMQEAATRGVYFGFPAIQQYLILEVRRDNLVNDTINELSKCASQDLKKPLKVKFHGEEAEDAGGVRKEFFMLLLKEILDPKYGMFAHYQETRAIWFSELSLEEQGMYFLIGLLCGLAIYNFTIINLPFPLVLYKKLLAEPVELDDIGGLCPTLMRSLHSLLDYEGDDVEDVFCLSFVMSREVFGSVQTDELKPGGANILVTQKNKQEYVDLYVDFILNKSIAKHFDAFNRGFHKVCGGRVLRLFQSHELMDLVVGNENYDWYALQENAEYKNGYSFDHPTIRLFWEVFHEMSLEQKKNFLLFLTGSDRIPILGMKAVRVIIQRTVGGDSYLPVAHTCFNLLDLPLYNTKEKLRYKLLQAIQQTQGFALA
ncbi:probable E3 ubiquitin-protein ligase HERC4 isoform X2 [Daphnia pulex]|uniref:probable E3 ubiquitin-protein ligase HERC4 isoform X2 n=1 Tax=Daphnia pulex TaxID=6669 RepID=UPI001EDD2327|nr:probable E3 ubiquitin-protein ligase HERC4 isoform X2 [Daphnia pulex]